MYHLVNANVHRYVSSEKKRDELVTRGYRVIEDEQKASKKKADKTKAPKEAKEP